MVFLGVVAELGSAICLSGERFFKMKPIARSLVVVLLALIAVPALVVSVTLTAAVQLLAVTGFYMGGTQHPLSTPPDDPGFFHLHDPAALVKGPPAWPRSIPISSSSKPDTFFQKSPAA